MGVECFGIGIGIGYTSFVAVRQMLFRDENESGCFENDVGLP